MKATMATNTSPSSITQRVTYALTTFFSITTTIAPMTGPRRVPAPPAITMSSASAELVSARTCGLTNWL